jgi:hypothetical protein
VKSGGGDDDQAGLACKKHTRTARATHEKLDKSVTHPKHFAKLFFNSLATPRPEAACRFCGIKN